MGAIHDHNHDRWSRQLRTIWNQQPDLECVTCGYPLTACWQHHQRTARRPPTRCTWQAGHQEQPDGTPIVGRYQPQCSYCNQRTGAAKGNRQRRTPTREPHTETW